MDKHGYAVTAAGLALAGLLFVALFLISAYAQVDSVIKFGHPAFEQKVAAISTSGIFMVVAAGFFVGAAILTRRDAPSE